jgi:predicted lipoprotein with Yx(FWY)xxD motif
MKGARVGVLTAIAGLGLLGLTACGSDSSGTPVSQQQQQLNQPAAAGPRANLVAQDVGTIGLAMTNHEGKTLYMFSKDANKPAAVSNCYDACATAWPPLLAEGKELTFTGVDEKLIGTVTRKDGTKQVTINQWPVYTFAKDAAPGDAKGQGMGGTWFVITPEGKKAQAAAPAGSPAPQQPKQPAQKSAEQPPANTNTGGESGYDNGSGY